MKKNFYSMWLGAIVFAFLFSSCSSLTNFSIEKRQHRGGYYVDWVNGKVKSKDVKANELRVKRSEVYAKTTSSPSVETKQYLSSDHSNVWSENKQGYHKSLSEQPKVAKAKRNSVIITSEPVASKVVTQSERLTYALTDGDDAQSSSDTPTWVIAVLCILLPPLAVFLKFGIGSEFWISLLLTLLFWIPGVIYAFIVCF